MCKCNIIPVRSRVLLHTGPMAPFVNFDTINLETVELSYISVFIDPLKNTTATSVSVADGGAKLSVLHFPFSDIAGVARCLLGSFVLAIDFPIFREILVEGMPVLPRLLIIGL